MSLEALPEFPCPQNPNPSFGSSLLSHPPPFLPSSAHARLLTRWRCEAGEGLSSTASAACHFIVLGRIFSYFSLSRFHSCPRYRHWPNPCPSPPSCGCAYSRSSAPPKGDRAQAQLEVLLFFPSHLFSQSTFFFFFLSWINFWFTGMNLESSFCGRFKTGPLFFLSFIPPLIPRLRPALQWAASLHVCISRPSRMRIRAAACSCHNPAGCSR